MGYDIQFFIAVLPDDLKNAFIAAVATLVFNLLLTSQWGAIGTAVVWIIAEALIMVLSIIVIYQKFKFVMDYRRLLNYCICYTPLLLLSLLLYHFLNDDYAIVISLAVLTTVFIVINEVFILKNKVALQLLQSLNHKE